MYMYVHELMSSDGRRTEVDSSFIHEVLYNIIYYTIAWGISLPQQTRAYKVMSEVCCLLVCT